MIVEEIMKTEIVTVTPTVSIAETMRLMETKKIRHIPVIDGEQQLVGIVTLSDIRDAAPSIFRANEHVEDMQNPVDTIMKKDVITGHPLDFVEEIAALFYEHKIGCLPITNGRKLVGIVTETDLLRTLVELTGAHQPGSQIEIRVPNLAGKLSDITSLIKNRKANILSVLVYPDKKNDQYKILVIRLQTMNPTLLIQDLKQSGYDVLWPNLPGVSL
ncbi:CBS domain-containing protein [Bacillus sp. EB106-08-02-XG196]|uniref:acetoin utilization AcuB family protein n=1 Tax=Bacillus sp. EB106-08-02-XG196 TaxID=2737049 RepID=UPI0015C4B436|nr:acetoin utilization AcuB family protein [Bacillus sp. EB106-08-02-XG196]NWQ43040.1 CBS domain-containing protein [Bacillus sp. EB106-08-02-XG196]